VSEVSTWSDSERTRPHTRDRAGQLASVRNGVLLLNGGRQGLGGWPPGALSAQWLSFTPRARRHADERGPHRRGVFACRRAIALRLVRAPSHLPLGTGTAVNAGVMGCLGVGRLTVLLFFTYADRVRGGRCWPRALWAHVADSGSSRSPFGFRGLVQALDGGAA
jgi:hypothetical protein